MADTAGEKISPTRGARIEIREIAYRFAGARAAFSALSSADAAIGQVLESLSLTIEAGEFVTLLGPSGCGKSTLLRLMAKLLSVQTGSLNVSPSSARGGFVFQDATLLPWRTVLANVEIPRELSGELSGQRLGAARAALERVGLSAAALLYPRELSGGMRMRVSIARALSFAPALLFLDEPFAALDENTRHDLQMQLRRLREELGFTVVFVTHSLSEAAFLSDRVIVFSPRPAHIVADHRIALPRVRADDIRTSEAFSREVRQLQELMRRGHA